MKSDVNSQRHQLEKNQKFFFFFQFTFWEHDLLLARKIFHSTWVHHFVNVKCVDNFAKEQRTLFKVSFSLNLWKLYEMKQWLFIVFLSFYDMYTGSLNNTSNPNFSIHTLHTLLLTFHLVQTRRICLNIKAS